MAEAPLATRHVRGAWATLGGASADVLDGCLALPDPRRQYNRAFREGRWDGNIRLHRGCDFPAGLVPHVLAHLQSTGWRVRVSDFADQTPVDVTPLTATYLGPVGATGGDLWPHQVETLRALLAGPRGSARVPTGAGKTEIIAAGAKYLWETYGWRSVIVTPKKGLCYQTAERLRRYYGTHPSVGIVGDGRREPGDVIVATAQTLASFRLRHRRLRRKVREAVAADPLCREVVSTYEVLWLDEAHHAPSDQWYEIAQASQATRRYGLSGTPFHHEEIADLKFIGATGPLVYDVSPARLIDLGLVARPKIVMVSADAVSGPALPSVWVERANARTGGIDRYARPLPYGEAYAQGIVANARHNRAVVRAVAWLVDQGKQTLLLCRQKAHWDALRELLMGTGIDFHAVWGQTDLGRRSEAKGQMQQRQTQCVLATTVWDEGEDVPNIEALVLAEGVKVPTNVLQRPGRGMRKKQAGANEVWIVDFGPTNHPTLLEHAIARVDMYEAEGYDVIVQDRWPAADADLLPFGRWDAALAAFRARVAG